MRICVLRSSRGGAKAVSELSALPFEGRNLECLPVEITYKWSLGSSYHGCHSITCLLLNSHFERFDLGKKVFLSSKEVNWKYSLGCLFEFYICIPITVSQGCIIYNLKHFFSTVMNEIWANLPACVLIAPLSLWVLKASSISTIMFFSLGRASCLFESFQVIKEFYRSTVKRVPSERLIKRKRLTQNTTNVKFCKLMSEVK